MRHPRLALVLSLLAVAGIGPALSAADAPAAAPQAAAPAAAPATAPASAPMAAAEADPWAAWRFLAGDWTGVEDRTRGTGAFSFHFELGDKVLVRRNHGDVPAIGGRPAAKHDDLMVVSLGADGKKDAIYFDNEGHVIRYAAAPSADGKSLVFVTAPTDAAPRFRLTYTRVAGGDLDIRFEIAPPGAPENFSLYLAGHGRRAGAAPPPK